MSAPECPAAWMRSPPTSGPLHQRCRCLPATAVEEPPSTHDRHQGCSCRLWTRLYTATVRPALIFGHSLFNSTTSETTIASLELSGRRAVRLTSLLPPWTANVELYTTTTLSPHSETAWHWITRTTWPVITAEDDLWTVQHRHSAPSHSADHDTDWSLYTARVWKARGCPGDIRISFPYNSAGDLTTIPVRVNIAYIACDTIARLSAAASVTHCYSITVRRTLWFPTTLYCTTIRHNIG